MSLVVLSKVKLSQPAELDALMDSTAYDELLKNS